MNDLIVSNSMPVSLVSVYVVEGKLVSDASVVTLSLTFCYFCSFMAWTHDSLSAPLDGMVGVFLVPGVIMAIAAIFKVGL